MPIIPSVFQPIRSNDFQQRPVKTYKHYKVLSNNFSTTSGYFRHNAVYRRHTPHILADDPDGIGTLSYPINTEDSTNQHVVWNAIDHKYYRNYNPAHSADFLDIDSQKRFLWHSASLFTAPYGQVGEKIKHGTFLITASIGSTQIKLVDDGKKELGEGIVVVFASKDDKVGVAVGVTNKLTEKYDAVKFVKVSSEIIGGQGGGGRKDFAQAGGQDQSKINKAYEKIKSLI